MYALLSKDSTIQVGKLVSIKDMMQGQGLKRPCQYIISLHTFMTLTLQDLKLWADVLYTTNMINDENFVAVEKRLRRWVQMVIVDTAQD